MSATFLEKSHDRAASYSVKMAATDYHKRGELSNSGNNILINQSPAHFRYYKDHPTEETPAKKIGTIVHSALLEPDLFLDTHIVMPAFSGKTKDGRTTTSGNSKEVQDKRERWLIDNHGKVVLDTETYHQTFGMIGSVMAHPKAKAILQKNHNELSFFGELGGVKVRARPDILRAGHLLADLKTTDDASFGAFQKSIYDYKYFRQAAFYSDLVSQVTGEKYDTFTFIAVEKSPPYAVAVYVLDEASLDRGREDYHRGLKIYRECLFAGKWPAYSDDVVPMNLPHFVW